MCSELNAYRVENIELSESGFARLGYNTVDQDNPYEDATINEDVATFLDGDSSYGFYFVDMQIVMCLHLSIIPS